MQVTLEQLEPCKVALSVEVDAEEVNRAFDKVFREVAQQVSVPGFRKGRAPRHILERVISADVVRDQAISDLVPEAYRQALEENHIEPVARAEFDWQSLERDQPFRFTATVPTQPEVRLCDYRDIPAHRRKIEVADRDVELDLDLLRRRTAHVEDAEETTAAAGMLAVVDLLAFRGDRQLKSRSRTDVAINMDDTQSMPAFNVTIDGMTIGETREMPVRYPDGYQDAVLASKEILYRITLKGLKRIAVPELDEEFAKSQGAESVEELRAKARERVEQTAREVADREVRDQVTEYVVGRSEVCFPEVLIDEIVADTLNDERKELAQRGTTLEEYLRAQESDMTAHERELREDARRRMRTQLVLDKIAADENIEVAEEDINAEMAQMAAQVNLSPEQMRSVMERQDPSSMRNLRLRILFRKVVDRLMEGARITEE